MPRSINDQYPVVAKGLGGLRQQLGCFPLSYLYIFILKSTHTKVITDVVSGLLFAEVQNDAFRPSIWPNAQRRNSCCEGDKAPLTNSSPSVPPERPAGRRGRGTFARDICRRTLTLICKSHLANVAQSTQSPYVLVVHCEWCRMIPDQS